MVPKNFGEVPESGINLHRISKIMAKFNIQIITAAVLAIGGLVLLFCGTYIDPQGEISDSLLIGFGEVATFSGALFGIDAAYSKKLWDITNLFANRQREKQSEERCTKQSTDTREVPENTKSI